MRNDDCSMPAGLVQWVGAAKQVSVLSGAGMSAESGVATFGGGEDSLWRRFDPLQMASAAAFQRDPPLVWGWYLWRMAQVRAAQPHAGHAAVATLAQHVPLHVVTQNVDDLHERAGSRDVVHLHGSLFACRCADCGMAVDVDVPASAATAPELRVEPPSCRLCAGRVRPGVVWFGEMLPEAAWSGAVAAMECCDLVLVVGTSGLVHPAAALPALARQRGACVVEINPQPSVLEVDLRWRIGAAAGLSALLQAVVAAA
jgi:NAD-dependent deacetylase